MSHNLLVYHSCLGTEDIADIKKNSLTSLFFSVVIPFWHAKEMEPQNFFLICAAHTKTESD